MYLFSFEYFIQGVEKLELNFMDILHLTCIIKFKKIKHKLSRQTT